MEYYSGKKTKLVLESKPREGDHQWWISDLRKFKKHYPSWKITYYINDIIEDIYIKSQNIQ